MIEGQGDILKAHSTRKLSGCKAAIDVVLIEVVLSKHVVLTAAEFRRYAMPTKRIKNGFMILTNVKKQQCFQEIFPGQFEPSISHKFIRQLEVNNQLLRNYTQNIDTLEKQAKIEKVVECHGSFGSKVIGVFRVAGNTRLATDLFLTSCCQEV